MGFFKRIADVGQRVVTAKGAATITVSTPEAAHNEIVDEFRYLDAYIVERYGYDPLSTFSPAPANVCPSCGSVFDEFLTRSRKCLECGEQVAIRKIDGGYVSLTPQQVDAVDERKELLATYRAAFRRVVNFGYGAHDFTSCLDGLGAGYSPRDAAWKLLNNASLVAAQEQDMRQLCANYSEKAKQFKSEGRDPNNSVSHENHRAREPGKPSKRLRRSTGESA